MIPAHGTSDPDGQVLEIATRGPGYALDEPADALGGKVLTPPEAELVGGRDELEIESRNHPEPVPDITPEMALQGIHHITGITGDIDRAHDFYTGMLGLRRVKMSVNQDDPDTPHHFWATYDGHTVAPHSTFTLFGWHPDAPRAREGIGQTHHIAFRAADAQQQLAWREYLLERGVAVTEVRDRLYFQSIYFRAPDGQLLEIATDGPGFSVDEDPSALGEVLQLPARLDRRRDEIAANLPGLE